LALKERDRSRLFIATKCLKRSGDDLKREIEESFERLQLEVVDLMQIHAIDQERTLSEVMGPGGSLRVIEEYRKAGKIRFVGLTGHTHPEIFARMVQEYDFDTVLNPLGPVNRVWNDFAAPTIALARARNMGVIAMKVMAAGKAPAEERSLYLRYALGPPADLAIVGMDSVEHVEENVRVAENFVPLSQLEEKQVLERALALVPKIKRDLWWLPEQRMAS
jgi:predicted aldo/keto reductase-like oxidoreductase